MTKRNNHKLAAARVLILLISVENTAFDLHKLIIEEIVVAAQDDLMPDTTIIIEMDRHAAIVSIKAKHRNLEIARFLQVTTSSVCKVRKELSENNADELAATSKRKQHYQRSADSLPHNTWDLQMSKGTIRNVLHQDFGCKSHTFLDEVASYVRADPTEAPTVVSTKFPATLMVFGVVRSEGHIMTPPSFPQGCRVNADAYVETL
ncbi:hypothetical protein ACTXT7_010668 [Hymenolepis weldensis]